MSESATATATATATAPVTNPTLQQSVRTGAQELGTPGLDIAGLEAVYDTLAQAIDQAGEARSELFLVKLALLNAQALGDAGRFQQQVDQALADLAGSVRSR